MQLINIERILSGGDTTRIGAVCMAGQESRPEKNLQYFLNLSPTTDQWDEKCDPKN
jgi:hypothetical protein